MAANQIDYAALESVVVGTATNQDVLQQIIDVSRVPLEFSDRCATGTHSNAYTEWMMDRLQAPADNAEIDGDDVSSYDQTQGQRVGNHSQINRKVIAVSSRAESSDNIGFASAAAYQVNQRGQELMRDVEFSAVGNYAAFKDTGAAAGHVGSVQAWIDGKIIVPAENGASTYTQTNAFQDESTEGITGGGWENNTGGVIPAWSYTAVVNVNPMVEADLEAVMQALYENTGSRANRVGMSVPTLHSAISGHYFGASARVATLQAETGMAGPATAMTAVNAVLTDFGIVDLVPNTIMGLQNSVSEGGDATPNSYTFLVLDFDQLEISSLRPMRVEPIAKLGLSERRQISKDWTLKVLSSEALGMIVGLDGTHA